MEATTGMKRFAGWISLGLVVVLGAAFAVGNAGRVVSVNLGVFSLDAAPVTFVAFGGMVVGMAVVLAAGVNSDLKVRRLLQELHAKGEPSGAELSETELSETEPAQAELILEGDEPAGESRARGDVQLE